MWWNKYIGIPFYDGGRDETGIDCWGLARLVYDKEFGIKLPSFDGKYTTKDTELVEELFATYRENWTEVQAPEKGNLVLFRILGQACHVGIAISPTHFLHSIEGSSSAIEKFDSVNWRNRIVGYFKYSENKNAVTLSGIPHPLRTQRFTSFISEGTTVSEVVKLINTEHNISEQLKSRIIVMVDGIPVPEEKWDTTVLNHTNSVEYRAVPRGGDSGLRSLLMVAVIVVSIIYAPQLAGAITGSATPSAAAVAITQMGITTVGMMLVNAIAPIRPLDGTGTDPGSAQAQLMVNGGSNQATPYQAIPLVLGYVRITAPLGARTYAEPGDTLFFYRMLLLWGFGPLTVSNIQIGTTPIEQYSNINLMTVGTPGNLTNSGFDAIYGSDAQQIYRNVEMVNTPYIAATNTPASNPYLQETLTQVSTSLQVAIHFPQGLRGLIVQGAESGASFPTPFTATIEYKLTTDTNWTLFNVAIGDKGQDFSNRKDAFTYTKTFTGLPSGLYTVRVKRINSSVTDADSTKRLYHAGYFYTLTGFSNQTPTVDPIGCTITKSALRIQATDQLNSTIEGISALVKTVCLSWNGTSWVSQETNNPADLFRYVLQHPANAQRVLDSEVYNKIDLAKLQYWHDYCVTQGFTFNMVVAAQRSILDVLRDICAAGRASPAMVDGKWTVVIDEPRSVVVQHFTPHNSWGFQAAKALPRFPHALKVSYYDESQGYQQTEDIIYNRGQSAATASLFESISLPGVTNKTQVKKHARWHLAQSQLRPEIYSLSVDLEYLVCNRGDWVKVSHDVPMWGIGSGRIKNFINTTTLQLDEDMPMTAGTQYTIRIRTSTGGSVERTIAAVSTSGNYSTITLTTAVASTDAEAGNLFLFGALNSVSNDLIVLSIEPTSARTATLRLVDYSPSIYTIDTIGDTDFPPPFSPSITSIPTNLIDSITATPNITKVVSDESVMEFISAGVYRYVIKISFANALNLPVNTKYVQGQFISADSTGNAWVDAGSVSINENSISFIDVEEGATYNLRLRYVSEDSRVGPWVTVSNHTVVGKTNQPSPVTGFTQYIDNSRINLKWNANPEVDVIGYEVRAYDSGWGTTGYAYQGSSTSCIVAAGLQGVDTPWYIRAIDAGGLYSTASATLTTNVSAPANITSITESFASTSLTNASISLTWDNVSPAFGLREYQITYDTVTTTIKANSITLPADWVGNRTYTVKVVDNLGNMSTGYSKTITKLAPGPVTGLRTQVIDNNVLLYWSLPTKTTLPIDHVLIKKGSSWTTGTVVGTKSGEFTTLQELSADSYTYWVAAIDTDNREGTPASITAQVSQPPDFIFNASYSSTFAGTMSNASSTGNSIVLPVNTTETWQQHFVNNGWTSPQSQVNAGYPVYVQPGVVSGYYEEIFDYGTILGSSNVVVSVGGADVIGTSTTAITISVSADGTTYTSYGGLTSVFVNNFRYIKVRVAVTENSIGSIYQINSINVRLDTKLKTDSGTVNADSGTTTGTIVNFNSSFNDISSITLTPLGTSARYAVYSFLDQVINSTYNVSGGSVTVTAPNHGLVAGQNVRIAPSTGTLPSGIYTVVSVSNTNTYIVNTTVANTSGNAVTYPNSMRVYLFDSTGYRQSGTVSWTLRGN